MGFDPFADATHARQLAPCRCDRVKQKEGSEFAGSQVQQPTTDAGGCLKIRHTSIFEDVTQPRERCPSPIRCCCSCSRAAARHHAKWRAAVSASHHHQQHSSSNIEQAAYQHRRHAAVALFPAAPSWCVLRCCQPPCLLRVPSRVHGTCFAGDAPTYASTRISLLQTSSCMHRKAAAGRTCCLGAL